jgi:hypothetical protein
MQNKHTPGPWHTYNMGHGQGNPWEVWPDKGLTPICRLISGGVARGNFEGHANARLIAAAPELLEALERAAPCLQAAVEALQSKEDAACLKQVRGAINKAKGA